MKYATLLGLILGLSLLVFFLAWQGLAQVFALLFNGGFALLLLPLVWLPHALPRTEAWRLTFMHRPKFHHALLGIWVGTAVNTLLPVANIGGEVVKARLMILYRYPITDAIASVMVDKMLQVLAIILWGLIGLMLLYYLNYATDLWLYILLGYGILSCGALGFFLAQYFGMFSFVSKLLSQINIKHDNAADIDALIKIIYHQKARFLLATILKTLSYALQMTEVWLACYLLGHPISFLEATMLKSLTATISDIVFIIPNAYGIQEGAFIVIGGLLGLSPELALSLSIAIRIREIVIDIPGFLYWQGLESRALW